MLKTNFNKCGLDLVPKVSNLDFKETYLRTEAIN